MTAQLLRRRARDRGRCARRPGDPRRRFTRAIFATFLGLIGCVCHATGKRSVRWSLVRSPSMRAVPSPAAALLLCASAAAQPAAETLKYAIVRKGDQIGTHVVELRRKDAETSVRAETQVEVKIAFFTVYQFRQTDTEKWINGRLVSLHATTDDNGTAHRVEVTAASQGLRIQADGRTATAAADTVP